MRFDIVSLAVGFAAAASAQCVGNYFSFYNRADSAMSYQRLDPGLFPGTESPHLHSFDGGNGLSKSMDFATTQDSTCTTARVKTDKSLYWRPTLYYTNGSSFYRVPEMSTKIYYKYGDGNNWANVTAYPPGFNMIAGQPNRRADSENPAGVRWGCHEPDGSSNPIFANGFPKGFSTCKYGFASEVTYPSCWNGQSMDPKNPNAHMAYPNGNAGIGIENCPTTHRAARFPTLFIEYWWDVSSFKFGPNEAPWVLSNGDPTGYGFHADFMNGWATGVLEKAISENDGCKCGCGCGQEQMEQCFGSANVNKDDNKDWASCSAASPRDNDATSVLDALPGCNPLQYGPASATPVSGPGSSPSAAVSASASVKPILSAILPTGSYTALSPSAFPSFTAKLPQEQAAPAPNGGGYNAVAPMPTKASLPEGSSPSPSIAAEESTKCSSKPVVYKTITQTSTVTVAARATGGY
ncbi:WSC domain containing protein [Pyrenophora tritici-repentis]|nr:WSC domain containing protein [Pyrenophora tritici-repentis]KAI1589539.1 WSC domain containing protein [Pyrenophora tritici-repentis]